MTALALIAAGDRVVVGLAGPRFSDVPWAPINGQIYVVYTLRDGRIVRMDDYLSRVDATAAAGTAVKDWAWPGANHGLHACRGGRTRVPRRAGAWRSSRSRRIGGY